MYVCHVKTLISVCIVIGTHKLLFRTSVCTCICINVYLESMSIVDIARHLLASLIPVSDEYYGGHLSSPVGLFSVC